MVIDEHSARGDSAPTAAGQASDIVLLASRVGAAVAGPAASDVDREARFPREAVEALREHALLGALVPAEFGGLGATITDTTQAIRALAAHCASSALVLAMHSIQVAILVRHGTTEPLRRLLTEVAADQLLLANANSEVGLGGDIGQSRCALEPSGNDFSLDKQVLALSYGEHADAILATARRCPQSEATDQVQVVCRRPGFRLESLGTWDTMGLRGTCSQGFRLVADVAGEMVLPVAFSTIVNEGSGQLNHLFLSAVWVGLADAALARAHAFVRKAARKSIGNLPSSALQLSHMVADVQASRSLLSTMSSCVERASDAGTLDDVELTVALRNLKVTTSELGVDVAGRALKACGIEGFRRDSQTSLDRILRDAYGGLIMVNNDRYLRDNAQLLCVLKDI